jgi:molybdopterin biosynthesis enzyme
MLSVEEARATVLAGVEPPWDNSAMDGYAIRADDVRDAGDALAVIPGPLARAESGTDVELRWLDRG